MPEIIFCQNQKQNIFKILIYVSHLLEKEKDYSKMAYLFLDDENKLYSSEYMDKFKKIIYIINPFKGPYKINFRGSYIMIEFDIIDDHHLYEYIDHKVYEKPFHLKIKGTCHEKLLETFIQEAFSYSKKYNKLPDDDNKRIIYQYLENEETWETYHEINQRNIDTIYLPMDQNKKVLKDVEQFLSDETRKKYEKFGVPYHKTYCFYGPPGSGKTSLIHALCSNVKKNICIYRFNNNTTDQDIATSLKWMPKNSVFVMEDIDCIINKDNKNITFSGLLNIIDGISIIEGLIIFITTNHFIELDKAIKRPGRIDYILEFTYVNKEQLMKMLDVFYPSEKDDYDQIYQEIKKYKMTVAYIQKFLFSLYPQGNVLKNLSPFLEDFIKYHSINEKNMYL